MFKGFGVPKKKSVLEDNELTIGIVQHPVTKRWQTWISFTGHDIQSITAHNQREDANKIAKHIADAWSEGKYKTQEEVTAFIKSLPTDAVIDPPKYCDAIKSAGIKRKEVRKNERSKLNHPSNHTHNPNALLRCSLGQKMHRTGDTYQ